MELTPIPRCLPPATASLSPSLTTSCIVSATTQPTGLSCASCSQHCLSELLFSMEFATCFQNSVVKLIALTYFILPCVFSHFMVEFPQNSRQQMFSANYVVPQPHVVNKQPESLVSNNWQRMCIQNNKVQYPRCDLFGCSV